MHNENLVSFYRYPRFLSAIIQGTHPQGVDNHYDDGAKNGRSDRLTLSASSSFTLNRLNASSAVYVDRHSL